MNIKHKHKMFSQILFKALRERTNKKVRIIYVTYTKAATVIYIFR